MKLIDRYKIGFNLFKRDLLSKKTISSYILLFVFIHMTISGINKFLILISDKINPFFYCLYFEQNYTKLLIYIPLIIILSDIAKLSKEDDIYIIRLGRRNWVKQKILNIFLHSFIYFLIIQCFTFIILNKNIRFEWEWGTALETLFKTDATSNFEIFLGFSKKVYDYFSIIQSFGFSLLLNVIVGVLVGLIIYYFNLKFDSKIIGEVIILFLLLLENVAYLSNKIKYFNPLSWNTLSYFTYEDTSLFSFTIYYVLVIGIILSIFLYIAIQRNFKNKNIV